MSEPLEPIPNWRPEERPSMPGSPSTPLHSNPVRVAYALAALLLGITGGLGTALVSANLSNIQGHLGLTPVQGSWLTASYLMVSVSANLLLIKFRQQYGMRLFAEIGLGLYAVVTFLHLFVESYPMALFVRAASGLAGATVSTLGVLYMLQAFRKADMGKGLVFGLGLSQLATPLAWLLSPTLLDLGEWHTLYLFESGLATLSLATVVVLKLPPGIRIKAFEPLDFLTFILLAPGLALIAAVLAQGRIQWWREQEWIALALIAAIVLITTALLIEHYRRNPLIQTRWLSAIDTLRFAFGALCMRLILSEQTYGAAGLLQTLGMGPDQLRPLYAVMLLALAAGIVTSALTMNDKTTVVQIVAAIVLIVWGSFLSASATSLTRPHNLFISQAMLSFASGLFLGPMLLIGVMKALKNGPNYIVTFSVLFGMTQSFGGLAGPALYGTFQIVREKFHSSYLVESIDPTNPIVSQRLALHSGAFAHVQTDPALQAAQGAAQLSQIVTREANVLAFNDVAIAIGLTGCLFMTWSLFHIVRAALKRRQALTGPAEDSPATRSATS